MIEIIERLIGKGYDLRIFDKNVNLARLVGANRDFILNRIPHISRLMVNGIERVLDHAQTIVIGNKDPEFENVLGRLRDGQHWWISCESQIAGVKMASTTVSAGKHSSASGTGRLSKEQISESLGRLSGWLEKNDYRGYDTFDGLNAKYLRPLTFETKFLRTVLQQGVRRFPLNVRPLLGIPKSRSTKGMGLSGQRFHASSSKPPAINLGRTKRNRHCNGWSKTNRQAIRAHAGAITSIINPEVFICRRVCRRSFGPR